MPTPLTSLSHGAGCGCKLPAAALRPIVAGLPAPADPRVLVGREHGRRRRRRAPERRPRDRADRRLLHADRRRPVRVRAHRRHERAVGRLRDGRHAAVGARTSSRYPLDDARARTCCARSCAAAPTRSAAAGAGIVGGHSIDDPEPKYGLAVTGIVDPRGRARQRRRPGRRRARAHQAARRRRRWRPRSSAACAAGRSSSAPSRSMTDAQRRRGRAGARRAARTRSPT